MSRLIVPRTPSIALLLALFIAGSCAPHYLYQPRDPQGVAPSDELTIQYPVPPESPRGVVHVTSFGVTNLEVRPGQRADLIHVRLGVANDSAAQSWTVDTRLQTLAVGAGAPMAAAYANSDVPARPFVTIERGASRAIDLYYPVPPGVRGAQDLPTFALLWQVQTDARVVAHRTPFERANAADLDYGPAPAFMAVRLGWGPYWWYDPLRPLGYAPVVHGYRHPWGPTRPPYWGGNAGRGPRPSGWRARPPASSGWRGTPPGGGGGEFRGTPPGRR